MGPDRVAIETLEALGLDTTASPEALAAQIRELVHPSGVLKTGAGGITPEYSDDGALKRSTPAFDIETFLVEMVRVRNWQPTTVVQARQMLLHISDYMHLRDIDKVTDLTVENLRDLFGLELLSISTRKNNHSYRPITPATWGPNTRKNVVIFVRRYLYSIGADDHPLMNLTERDRENLATKVSNDPGTVRWLSEADYSALLETAGTSGHRKYRARNVAILTLLWETGSRAHEVLQFDVDRLDHESRTTQVQAKAKMSAGKRTQARQWRDGGVQALTDWLKIRSKWTCSPKTGNGPDRGALFLNKDCERLTQDGLKMLLRRLGQRSGIEVTPHDLRRGGAVHLIRNSVDIYTVSKWLGHESITTTESYLRTYLAEEAMAKNIPATI